MKEITKKLILNQGFNLIDIEKTGNINWLVRWTPIVCSIIGLIGILIKNPYYLITLGLLTYIGALTNSSFYDYIYNFSLRFILKTEKIPMHGNQRKFGCAIGGTLFILSGIGFLFNNPYLSYIPGLLIISLAYIAGITQWCFASQLYNLIFNKNDKCC